MDRATTTRVSIACFKGNEMVGVSLLYSIEKGSSSQANKVLGFDLYEEYGVTTYLGSAGKAKKVTLIKIKNNKKKSSSLF